MKNRFYILAIFISALITGHSCSYFSADETEAQKNETGMLPAEDRKYAMKSAIIILKSTKQILGSDIETTIYFDDYGDKYCNITETILKYKNTKIITSSVSITKNDFNYTYNPEKKTGTRSKNQGNFNPMHIDFAKLDRQTQEANGIKMVGETECLGRTCEVYVMENTALEMSGRYEVWNKIPLKFSTKIGASQMEMYATEVQENPIIPPAIFDVPADIEIKDAVNPLASPSEPGLSDTLSNLPSSDK